VNVALRPIVRGYRFERVRPTHISTRLGEEFALAAEITGHAYPRSRTRSTRGIELRGSDGDCRSSLINSYASSSSDLDFRMAGRKVANSFGSGSVALLAS